MFPEYRDLITRLTKMAPAIPSSSRTNSTRRIHNIGHVPGTSLGSSHEEGKLAIRTRSTRT